MITNHLYKGTKGMNMNTNMNTNTNLDLDPSKTTLMTPPALPPNRQTRANGVAPLLIGYREAAGKGVLGMDIQMLMARGIKLEDAITLYQIDTAAKLASALASRPKQAANLSCKVSEKGAVSVYGLGRFPVTLYKEQWVRLISPQGVAMIADFIKANDGALATKGADHVTATPAVFSTR